MNQRKAFSLVEVVVAISLVALVAVLVVPRLGGGSRDGDRQARVAISAVADAQMDSWRNNSKFFDASEPTIQQWMFFGFVNFTNAASQNPETVSMGLAGTRQNPVVGLASMGNEKCWYLRLTPNAGSLWAVGGTPCTGAAAATVSTSDPTLGGSPERPLVLQGG